MNVFPACCLDNDNFSHHFCNPKISWQLNELTNGSSPSPTIPWCSSKVFKFTWTPRSWSLSLSSRVTCSQKRYRPIQSYTIAGVFRLWKDPELVLMPYIYTASGKSDWIRSMGTIHRRHSCRLLVSVPDSHTQRGRGSLVQLHTESHYGLQLAWGFLSAK